MKQQAEHLMMLMDEGVLDPRAVANACLVWLSDDDIRAMSHNNELPSFEDENEEDDE